MAGRGDHFHGLGTEFQAVAALHGAVDARDLGLLRRRADDLQTEALFEREIGLDMIGMVVSGEDQRRRPAGVFHRGKDGGLLRRVDQRDRAARRLANEHAEIVLATHELLDLDRHGRSP